MFAAPAASAAPHAGGGLAEVTLALLAIVALIAGLAWLMKRTRGFGAAGRDRIQVLSERALGPKERCVLVRVGATEILVGVAAGSVQHAARLSRRRGYANRWPAAAPPAATPAQPTFKALLMRSLGK